MWLVVNGWGGSQTFNQQLLGQLIAELLRNGQDTGIYSSPAFWTNTFGAAFVANTSMPLWFASDALCGWRLNHITGTAATTTS